jgi:hypothetical protein
MRVIMPVWAIRSQHIQWIPAKRRKQCDYPETGKIDTDRGSFLGFVRLVA